MASWPVLWQLQRIALHRTITTTAACRVAKNKILGPKLSFAAHLHSKAGGLNKMTKSVLVALATGCEELELVSCVDVFRRAGLNVTVASVDPTKEVKGAHQLNIVGDGLIAEFAAKHYDCIALPGGMPGAEHLRDSKVLTEMLKKQKSDGRLIAAICASPVYVLEHHGLLEGCVATCYPALKPKLLHPTPDDSAAVVKSHKIVTSKGPGTAGEFALAVVDELLGHEAAKKVASAMLIAY